MDAQGWTDAVANAARGDHIVQAYEDDAILARSVATFIEAGARENQPALVVATPGHRALFAEALERGGERCTVIMLDAEETLASLRAGGPLDWERFREIVGALIDQLSRDGRVPRVYGEMVDVLWQRGERDAALQLEDLWNRLAQTKAFALFCAYRIDVLDGALYGGPLECICKAHTHFLPAQRHAGFDDAVLEATERVLDPSSARMLLTVSAREPLATHMPHGQAMLIWLREHMPRTSELVLRELSHRYGANSA